jgi:hypothetical protein
VFRKQKLLIAILFLAAGCTAKESPTPPGAQPPPPPPNPVDPMDPPPIVASNKARLTFKGGARYASGLAASLEIPRDALCKELSLYDCTDQVHAIALGGVEPYRSGIYEPLPNTAVTTPIAVERVALSACARRARDDFAAPDQALIFRGDAAGADLPAAVDKLYQRLLQRSAEASEVEHLRELHREMATVGHPSLGENWAQLACFAVATSLEALFY